jgi:hypothetical protein
MSYLLEPEKRQPGRATSHKHGIVLLPLEIEGCDGPPCEDFRGDYQILIDKTSHFRFCTSAVHMIDFT